MDHIELARSILLKARDAHKAQMTSEKRESKNYHVAHGRISGKRRAPKRCENRKLLKQIIQNEGKKRMKDNPRLNGNQIKLISRTNKRLLCNYEVCDHEVMMRIDGNIFKVPFIATIEGYIKEII